MRSNRRVAPHWMSARAPRYAAALALVLVVLSPTDAAPLQDKRLFVFAPQANYSIVVVGRDGREYVGLIELFDPLAHPEVYVTGDTVRVRSGAVEAQFKAGKTRGRAGKAEIDLSGKLLLENGRPLVPLHSVPVLLSRVLGISSDLHETTRRLFIGNTGVRFTAEMKRAGPSALVLGFSSAVNPTVSTEPGRLKLSFARDPVISGVEHFKFDDANISSATYSESGGTAELTVFGKVPLMATFGEGGRTITVLPAPAGTAPAASQEAAPAPPASQPAATAGGTAAEPAAPNGTGGGPRPRYLVVIDPGHGGDDLGARLSDKLNEKDVTLALGRRLRAELQNRGVNALLLRDGDANLAYEQRAIAANAAHVAVYIGIHAGTPGHGVRLYTSLLPPAELQRTAFLPWETAQSFFIHASRTVAQFALTELAQKKIPALLMPADMRPLNNIAGAAIVVEVAPPGRDVNGLLSAGYQQNVVTALAAAIVNARGRLEEVR